MTPAIDGNGNRGDWTSLKAWANAIGIVGIPGAIAVFVVYMGATELPKLVKATEQAVVETRAMREVLEEQRDVLERLIRMTQRTCNNAAGKDENARQRCFDP